MKGLFLKRGRGKTTASIYTSAMTGCPIVVANEISKHYIKEKATELGVTIPDPISIYECARGKKFPNGVLIDNAEAVIKAWAQENLNAPVVAFTMSIDGDSV
ncbi:MAG: hypothetical protein HFF70_13265 [Oscillospiraceae bacterium]|jgi:hypothetical protein|nr:hypothetical protein [Oscillospiraceae bacterium]